MTQQDFVIVCEQVLIDKQSHSLSLINAFENINGAKLPIIHSKFAVVTKFKGGEANKKLSHQILVKDDKKFEIARIDSEILFSENGKAQAVGYFMNTKFPEFGTYNIEIYLDGELQPLSTEINIKPKE